MRVSPPFIWVSYATRDNLHICQHECPRSSAWRNQVLIRRAPAEEAGLRRRDTRNGTALYINPALRTLSIFYHFHFSVQVVQYLLEVCASLNSVHDASNQVLWLPSRRLSRDITLLHWRPSQPALVWYRFCAVFNLVYPICCFSHESFTIRSFLRIIPLNPEFMEHVSACDLARFATTFLTFNSVLDILSCLDGWFWCNRFSLC